MLEQFVEQMLDNEGSPIESETQFFRMDGSPDMRKHAKLGTCSCCDYLAIMDDSILLIEETKLLQYIDNEKSAVDYLDEDDKEKFVQKKVLLENRAKVYGSLLVLCRLSQEHSDLKSLISNKAHTFWLVVRGRISNEDSMYLDSLKNRLEPSLKGELSNVVIDTVKVLPLDKLQEQLYS